VATNDNWLPADSITMASAGAFALSAGSKDSALVAALAPGAYTVPVASTDASSGVVLLEVYDASPAGGSTVVNASTRAFAGTGNAVLIVGFVINGTGSVRCLIRAVGPALSTLGVADALADPALSLFLGQRGRRICAARREQGCGDCDAAARRSLHRCRDRRRHRHGHGIGRDLRGTLIGPTHMKFSACSGVTP
jgi:hypothetical protein